MMKKFLLIISVSLILPMAMRAQTTVLNRFFVFPSSETTHLMDDDNDLTYVNCYAIKGHNLQVGSGSGVGSVSTRNLALNGNVSVVLYIKATQGTASFCVSVFNDEKETETEEYSLANGETFLKAIFVNNFEHNSNIRIKGKEGKFDLVSFDIIDIEDGLFHESFNMMVANNHEAFSTNSNERYAPVEKCDNYTGTSLSNVLQSEACVLFVDFKTNSYTTPPVAISNGNMALLSFRLARGNNAIGVKFSLSCNGDAKMSPINSENLTDLANSRSITSNNAPGIEEWSDYYVVVTNMSNTTQFVFQGEQMYLDEIKLTSYTALDEGIDNTTMIDNNQGCCCVTLIRTLGEDYWNTLCLPFDITQTSFEEATHTNAEIQTLTSVTDGVFRFNNVAANAIIEAGTPFLVKVNKQVVNPQFPNVVITNTPAQAVSAEGTSGYQFVGTYSPVTLSTDKTNLFLGNDGSLHYPSSPEVSTMKGLRAYFVVPNGTVPARVNINVEDIEVIDAVEAGLDVDAVVYDLRGQRRHADALRKGIYIRNGRKVIVK